MLFLLEARMLVSHAIATLREQIRYCKTLFQKVGRNRPFVIHARNHNFKEVFNDYHEAIRYDRPKAQREEAGKKLALFNAQGHLELAVFKGSSNYGGGASTLFGLTYLDPIRVAFINDA